MMQGRSLQMAVLAALLTSMAAWAGGPAPSADLETFGCTIILPFSGVLDQEKAEVAAIFKAQHCVAEKSAAAWQARLRDRKPHDESVHLALTALVKMVLGPCIEVRTASGNPQESAIHMTAILEYERADARERVRAANDRLFLLQRFRTSLMRGRGLIYLFDRLTTVCNSGVSAGNPETALDPERLKTIVDQMRAHRFNENALYAWRDETGKPWREGLGSAHEWLEQAIRLDPGQPDYYVNRGELYLNDLFFNRAIENFKLASKLDPNCAEAFAGLSMAYGWLNDPINERANAEIACRVGDCGPQMILDVLDRRRANPSRGDPGAEKRSAASGGNK